MSGSGVSRFYPDNWLNTRGLLDRSYEVNMSSTKIFGLLILAVSMEFLGIFLGRALGLSQFAAVGLGLVPAMLLAFPVIRHWYGGRLSFKLWLLIIAGISSLVRSFTS